MSGTGHEGPSVIEQLAAYVTGEAFDRLPAATVVAARRAILDTLGVTLAGAVEPTAERVRTMIEHRRAGQEATIVGTSLRGAVEDAALANGTASHALDYDDVQASLSGHPSAPILSAALALAEQRRASGADLLTAFVVGVEIEAAQLEAKFRDCAARVLPAARIDRLVTMLEALETVPDVSELARALATT